MSQIDLQELKQFQYLEFAAKQVVEGFITGLHKSPFHGFSVEFAEHKIYNKGESTKHIDWKLFGRTDKLFVKRFEEETNLRCHIIIDNSSSMQFPVVNSNRLTVGIPTKGSINKIGFTAYSAAALIELFKHQRDAVGLTIFSDKIETQTQAKSNSVHHKMLFHELERLMQPYNAKAIKKTSAIATLHQIAESIHKRSLIIIFSDMMDSGADANELFSALGHIKHNKHEVILFHVTEKNKEVDFNFENRPYQFIDLESGAEIKLNPNQVKQQYIDAIAHHQKELKLKCHQYKIDFVEAYIDNGFEQILLPYLLKRSKMV